jgi:sulfatase modifying factor 1
MKSRHCFVLAVSLSWMLNALAMPPNPAQLDWVALDGFEIARTETTVAQFGRFVEATQMKTTAERDGGGHVYEAGWVRQAGWTWHTPLGRGQKHELWPAVHVTFEEAQMFCRWAGGQLPNDAQWVKAAYTEMRLTPPAPFERGRTYPYPTGASPQGAQCLGECGADRSQPHRTPLSHGIGPALAGHTQAGVNGLLDMGGNVWEWVDEPQGQSREKRTRGGSWWYGASPMRAEHLASKDAAFAAVYIGFRCVRAAR